MSSQSLPILLITANVGSVFEDPSKLLKTWVKEFMDVIRKWEPVFLAVHMQEVGGKTYEKSMEYVQEFVKILCEASELASYDRIRIYLDEDYQSAEHFTALGNLYFARNTITSLKIWNFLIHEWEDVVGKSIHTGSIESIPTKEKAKFPQNFFPECKWSRKGFLRTRWDIEGSVVDFVNIHLFHDASNLAACEEFPSVYCKSRRRALVHTLERFEKDAANARAPYFVFGDFNFRCDTEGVVKKLTETLTPHRVSKGTDSVKMQYRDADGQNVLTVGKKEFTHTEHQIQFKGEWLRKFDRELDPLQEILFEYPIAFPPSYPFEEDPTMPQNYMNSRCPGWCDRILMSPSAKQLIASENIKYSLIGEGSCMGDHKPVYLQFELKANQGMIRCSCSPHVLMKNSSSLSCLSCSRRFAQILVEWQKLDNIPYNTLLKKPPPSHPPPLNIQINVTDTENNLNVCMCAFYDVPDAQGDVDVRPGENSICPRCRNIISQQPMEHRRALISQRLMLANDVIVNRIDTQLLNAYSSTAMGTRPDPYTPESAESRSPVCDRSAPDYEVEAPMPNTRHDRVTSEQVSVSSGGVNPNQLKSRLERLQRKTRSDDDDYHQRQNNCCSCIIT
uniref:inositol-polyphosphate 5-phosphatase n=1 Tax=Nyssomyia neivai TaxID=330878 RepID=A0A1L8DYM5_9DIPT